MLDAIAEELPGDFIRGLNGGCYLLPDTKEHPESKKDRPLYTLGEYISRRDLGKYINIYYGSFMKVYPHVSPGELRQALKRVLIHEFTHHFEFLAGERGLEIKDAIDMERYRQS
jgi:hypothetical protein